MSSEWVGVDGGGAIAPSFGGGGQLAVAETYVDKVLGYNPFSYHPLDDAVGSPTAREIAGYPAGPWTGTANNITFGVAGIGDGGTAASFNGTTSVIDIYSVALSNAFVAEAIGNVGSMMIWFQVANAGVWTDGADRYPYKYEVAGGHDLYFRKNAANNRITYQRIGSTRNQATSTLLWAHLAMTWDQVANVTIMYFDAVAVGLPTTAPAWSGNPLDASQTAIGAERPLPVTNVHSGSLAHAALFDFVLTPLQITDLSTV